MSTTETTELVDALVDAVRPGLERPDIGLIYAERKRRSRRRARQRVSIMSATSIIVIGVALLAAGRSTVEEVAVVTSAAQGSQLDVQEPNDQVAGLEMQSTTPETFASADEALDYAGSVVLDALRDRQALASFAPGISSIFDVTPDPDDAVNPRRAELLITGQIVEIEDGPTFSWLRSDDGAAVRAEVSRTDANAMVSMYHVTVDIDRLFSATEMEPVESVRLALALPPSIDPQIVRADLAGLGSIVALLDSRSAVVDYDSELYAVLLDGALLGRATDGLAQFPAAPEGFIATSIPVEQLMTR